MKEEMIASNNIQFRASDDLRADLADRGESLGLTARRDLIRYYTLLRQQLAAIALSASESALLCDALNGTLNDFTIDPSRSLYSGIRDAIELDGLDKKWGVDGSALIDKLRAFTPLEAAAVLDAVERFWYEPDSYQIDDRDAKLMAVGLIRFSDE